VVIRSDKRNLRLIGQGHEPSEVELDGQGQLFPRAVLTIEEGAQVTVRNLTITGGNTNGDGGFDVGGGVGNHGNLRLEQVEVVDNHATNFDGGGIANLGPNAVLVVDRSPVRHNTALNGGGISNDRGTLTVINSRIEENTATVGGGGVSNDRGNVTLREGTLLYLNTALSGGGLQNDRGTTTLLSSAIVQNTAQRRDGSGGIGGGINNFGSPGNPADAHVFIENESDVTDNIATAGPGSGGGIFNAGRVTVQPRSSVFGNTPDNCVDSTNVGEGCPA
jgi:hypothetical protein